MRIFKKGQPVKVLLNETHNIVDDPIEHDATFVSEHADGKWADVDLAEEHAGGTRRLSVPLSVIKAAVLLLLCLGLALPSRAQDIGQVGFRTVFQQIFGAQQNPATNIVSPNSSAPGCVPVNNSPCAIPNLGQTNHFISVRTGTSNPTFKMNLEASVDGGTTWFSIADSSSDTALIGSGGITTFTATGYYPNLRINFIGGTNGGIFNVYYSGTFGVTTPQGGNVNPSLQDRRILAVAPNNTGQGLMVPATNIVQFPPYGSTAGSLYFKYITNNCAGGTIAITAGPDFNHMVAVTTIALANVATQQSFSVPDIKASVVQFTSTACGAETFDVEMSFARPGSSGGTGTGAAQVQTNGADPCQSTAILKNSAVITAPAAATTQIIAGVAGQQIFVCGYNVGVVVAVAGTVQWTSGTGGACGAATVTKTGAIPVNTAEPFSYGPGSTLFTAAAGSGVCLTLTGAGDNAAGIITFVQQ